MVQGKPAPKGSSVAFRHNKSGALITWASNRARLRPWEASIRSAAARARGRHPLLDGPMDLEVMFFFPQAKSPRSQRACHTVKPDLSKLVRGIEDAMTGVLYRDDAQIVRIAAVKVYSPDGTSGARITVRPYVAVRAERRTEGCLT